MPLWKLSDGRVLDLIHVDALKDIPDGTTLVAIDGTTSVKGVDDIDLDDRGGYLAYGRVVRNRQDMT